MVHCEKQAQSFVEECNGQVQIIQGELMTTEYFDGVAAEVEELLQVLRHCHREPLTASLSRDLMSNTGLYWRA